MDKINYKEIRSECIKSIEIIQEHKDFIVKLSYDEFHNQVIHVKHAPEIEYEWATGVAISKFLQGLKAGKNRTGTVNNKNRANGKTYGNQGFFKSSFNRFL